MHYELGFKTTSYNVYYVTGVITKITNAKYGNAYITDNSGGEFLLYGAYIGAENVKQGSDGKFSVTKDSTKLIDSSYLGKEVTAVGPMTLYSGTREFSPAAIIKSSTEVSKANITLSTPENGAVTTAKDSYNVAETVTLNVTPNDGYKASKVEVTVDGSKSNLTADSEGKFSFTAGLNNNVVVEFAGSDAKLDMTKEFAAGSLDAYSQNKSATTTSQTKEGITFKFDTLSGASNGPVRINSKDPMIQMYGKTQMTISIPEASGTLKSIAIDFSTAQTLTLDNNCSGTYDTTNHIWTAADTTATSVTLANNNGSQAKIKKITVVYTPAD